MALRKFDLFNRRLFRASYQIRSHLSHLSYARAILKILAGTGVLVQDTMQACRLTSQTSQLSGSQSGYFIRWSCWLVAVNAICMRGRFQHAHRHRSAASFDYFSRWFFNVKNRLIETIIKRENRPSLIPVNLPVTRLVYRCLNYYYYYY
jgi:hypothetical protein